MSDVLQLIKHVRLRPSGPLALLHQLPLLASRAGGAERRQRGRMNSEDLDPGLFENVPLAHL